MNKEQYFKSSRELNLPSRCPILRYCIRRAFTIYFFSDYLQYDYDNDVVKTLIRDGELPEDFYEKQVELAAESPIFSKGKTTGRFANMCPEVNLFDKDHSIPMARGKSTTDGYWDTELDKSKRFTSVETKHYSECLEFSNYMFDNDKIGNRRKKTKTRKAIPYKTKALLQKEINSECPFCDNKDVDHFQVHHIDENPDNNKKENLLMLCPNCHSKITKGDISKEIVINQKKGLRK